MNRVTTVSSARVSRDMRAARGLRDGKGTRLFGRVALIAMNGLLSTCVVVAMWLHPPLHRADGNSLFSGHTDLATYDTVFVSASAALPMEPRTIPVSAAVNSQERPGVGVLTLLVILIALGIAIKGIAAALKLVLMAIMELLRMLAAASLIFLIVLVMLIAQLGNDVAEPARPRTAAQLYGVAGEDLCVDPWRG